VDWSWSGDVLGGGRFGLLCGGPEGLVAWCCAVARVLGFGDGLRVCSEGEEEVAEEGSLGRHYERRCCSAARRCCGPPGCAVDFQLYSMVLLVLEIGLRGSAIRMVDVSW
jgi:hypothetical protein